MPRVLLLIKNLIPVRENGHGAEISVLIDNGAVVEGNAVALINLHQRGVKAALILFVQILFLQRKPDDQLRDLVCQHRVIPRGDIFKLCVGVQRFPPNRHQIRTVL